MIYIKYIGIEMKLTIPCPKTKTEILSKYCDPSCPYFKALCSSGKTLFGSVVCSFDEEKEQPKGED